VKDEEAEQRADRWVTKDPFHDVIPRALLSASDIYDYVRVTGMVHPFYPERLKDLIAIWHIFAPPLTAGASQNELTPVC
jgi:hypothetical protein